MNVQALITALENQRNSALNQAAHAAVTIAVLEDKVTSLQNTLDELEEPIENIMK